MYNLPLNNLLKAKGETCVSIIMPMHHFSRERKGDKIEVKSAVKKAKEDLKRHTTSEQFDTYETVIDEWMKKIDYTHNLEGLGLFLSPSVKEIVKFPFSVKEKIVVSDSFEIRDVAFTHFFAKPYYVLLLSEKDVRLLRGSLDDLIEVKDKNFPDVYEDPYEYEKPSRGSSYAPQANLKSTEGDKSIVEDMRLGRFFQVLDKRLSDYLDANTPLIVVAPTEEIALFARESNHQKNIVCTIKGHYTFMNTAELSDVVFPKYVQSIKDRILSLIHEYDEGVGFNLGIEGINNIWHAVKEGRGRKLVVEKDFTQEAFLQSGENRLLFKEPHGAHKVVKDIIDDIIEMMYAKGGDVYFADNGTLKDYGKMFLITRY